MGAGGWGRGLDDSVSISDEGRKDVVVAVGTAIRKEYIDYSKEIHDNADLCYILCFP